MFCQNCGNKINEGMRVCSKCGISVVNGDMSVKYRQPRLVGVETTKNLGLAIALSFLFGPLGLLYSTVRGAIILIAIDVAALLVCIVLGTATTSLAASRAGSGAEVAFGLIIMCDLIIIGTWPASIIWAWKSVKEYNIKVRNGILNRDEN